MRSPIISTTANSISSGGTISGDLTIDGDLTVNGLGGYAYSEVLYGDMKIRSALSTIALEVEQNSNNTALLIDQNANRKAIEISSVSTEYPSLFIDHNNSGDDATNLTAVHIDYDRTVAGSGTAAHNDIGILLDVDSRSLGTSTVKGMDINVTGHADGTSTATGIDVTVASADTNYAALFNGGNVGIGVTAPKGTLHVNDVIIASSPAQQTGYFVLGDGTTGDKNHGMWRGTANSLVAGNHLNIGTRDGLHFMVSSHAFGSGTERMTIDSSGNVGINIQTPPNTLSVSPVQYTSTMNASQSGQNVTAASGTPFTAAMVGSQFIYADGTSSGAITALTSSTIVVVTTSQTVSAQLFKIHYQGLQVKSDGNVGIGTAAPSTSLHVVDADGSDIARLTTNKASATNAGSTLQLVSDDGATMISTHQLGKLLFGAAEDSSNTLHYGAGIVAYGTETWSSSQNGTDLVLEATADGATSRSEIMRLDGNSRISLSNNDAGESNTLFGYAAGLNMHADADLNTFIGHQVGNASMTSAAEGNVGVGAEALGALTSGNSNVCLGTSAGTSVLAGSDNVMIGRAAGSSTTAVGKTVIIGRVACNSNLTDDADGTVAIGYSALTALTSGQKNVAVGFQAMLENAIGDSNIALGYNALFGSHASVQNDNNIAIGSENYDGSVLAAMGGQWGGACLRNIAIGTGSMTGVMNGASDNIAIGDNALNDLTSGDENTIIGSYAGDAVTGGSKNTAIGKSSFTTSTGGAYNTSLGHSSLGLTANADYNTAVGYVAGYDNSTGNYNTFIGAFSNVDTNTDSYHVRLGHYGGVKFFTAQYTLSNSYVGTPAAGHAAHSNALFTIPAFSYVRAIYATVVTPGHATHNFTIEFDSTLNVASGSAVGGLEVLGASASTTHWLNRSYDTQDGASDIAASSGVGKKTWVALNKDADDSTGWVAADTGVYIVHAGSNQSTDAGTDPVIQLTVEYTGVS